MVGGAGPAGLAPLPLRPIEAPRHERLEADAPGLGRYTIDVSLPPGATTAAGLPVILAVDGNLTFETVAAVVHGGLATASQSFPPSVVVGVGYPQDEGFASFYARRTFDFHEPWDMADPMGARQHEIFALLRAADGRPELTLRAGGYDRFVAFLGGELLPALARRYPIDPSAAARHTLVGHSGGGRLALRMLFDPASPFSRYVAISPGFGADEAGLVAAEAAYAAAHTDLAADVFVCAGDEETGASPDYALCRFGSGVTWTAERFAVRQWPSARLGWEIMTHEDHTSILPRAIAAGLRAVHRLRPSVHRAETAAAAAQFAAGVEAAARPSQT